MLCLLIRHIAGFVLLAEAYVGATLAGLVCLRLIAETWATRQFVPLNQKSATIPKTGIIADFPLMLTNYPPCGPLFEQKKRPTTQLDVSRVISTSNQKNSLATAWLGADAIVWKITGVWEGPMIRTPCYLLMTPSNVVINGG